MGGCGNGAGGNGRIIPLDFSGHWPRSGGAFLVASAPFANDAWDSAKPIAHHGHYAEARAANSLAGLR